MRLVFLVLSFLILLMSALSAHEKKMQSVVKDRIKGKILILCWKLCRRTVCIPREGREEHAIIIFKSCSVLSRSFCGELIVPSLYMFLLTIVCTIFYQITASMFGMYAADATAMPVHWMYDLRQLKNDYGTIKHYVKPKDKFRGSIMNLSNTGWYTHTNVVSENYIRRTCASAFLYLSNFVASR